MPYATLVRRAPHADSAVRACEDWLSGPFREPEPVARAVARPGLPERTIKRRFKAATGVPLMAYIQNLRIEEAKRLLEIGGGAIDAFAAEVGYENPGFFRSLFKRCTGLRPNQYRQMFCALAAAA